MSTAPAYVSPTHPTVADAIEHTLEWLDQQGCSQPDADRRHTRRSRYRTAAKITYFPAGATKPMSFDVTTRNLSRTGLSFIHKILIYPRQSVEVQLPIPDQGVRQFRGNVVRVRPAGIGLYEIAVEFTDLEIALV